MKFKIKTCRIFYTNDTYYAGKVVDDQPNGDGEYNITINGAVKFKGIWKSGRLWTPTGALIADISMLVRVNGYVTWPLGYSPVQPIPSILIVGKFVNGCMDGFMHRTEKNVIYENLYTKGVMNNGRMKRTDIALKKINYFDIENELTRGQVISVDAVTGVATNELVFRTGVVGKTIGYCTSNLNNKIQECLDYSNYTMYHLVVPNDSVKRFIVYSSATKYGRATTPEYDIVIGILTGISSLYLINGTVVVVNGLYPKLN